MCGFAYSTQSPPTTRRDLSKELSYKKRRKMYPIRRLLSSQDFTLRATHHSEPKLGLITTQSCSMLGGPSVVTGCCKGGWTMASEHC